MYQNNVKTFLTGFGKADIPDLSEMVYGIISLPECISRHLGDNSWSMSDRRISNRGRHWLRTGQHVITACGHVHHSQCLQFLAEILLVASKCRVQSTRIRQQVMLAEAVRVIVTWPCDEPQVGRWEFLLGFHGIMVTAWWRRWASIPWLSRASRMVYGALRFGIHSRRIEYVTSRCIMGNARWQWVFIRWQATARYSMRYARRQAISQHRMGNSVASRVGYRLQWMATRWHWLQWMTNGRWLGCSCMGHLRWAAYYIVLTVTWTHRMRSSVWIIITCYIIRHIDHRRWAWQPAFVIGHLVDLVMEGQHGWWDHHWGYPSLVGHARRHPSLGMGVKRDHGGRVVDVHRTRLPSALPVLWGQLLGLRRAGRPDVNVHLKNGGKCQYFIKFTNYQCKYLQYSISGLVWI